MSRSRQMGAPPRTTRIPVAGKKLEMAEAHLALSLQIEARILTLRTDFDRTPKWQFFKRRALRESLAGAYERYWVEVKAARDLANKRA